MSPKVLKKNFIYNFLFGTHFAEQGASFRICTLNSVLVFLTAFSFVISYRLFLGDLSAADEGHVFHHQSIGLIGTLKQFDFLGSGFPYRPLGTLIEALLSLLVHNFPIFGTALIFFYQASTVALLVTTIEIIVRGLTGSRTAGFSSIFFVLTGKIFIASNLINQFSLMQSITQLLGFLTILFYLRIRFCNHRHKDILFLFFLLLTGIYTREPFAIFVTLIFFTELCCTLTKPRPWILASIGIAVIHNLFPQTLPSLLTGTFAIGDQNFVRSLALFSSKPDDPQSLLSNLSQLEFRRFGHYWNSFSLTAISLCIYMAIMAWSRESTGRTFSIIISLLFTISLIFFMSMGFGFNQYEFIGWPTKMHLMGLPVLALFFFLSSVACAGFFWLIFFALAAAPLAQMVHVHSTHSSYAFIPMAITVGILFNFFLTSGYKKSWVSSCLVLIVFLDQLSNPIISAINNQRVFNAHSELANYIERLGNQGDLVYFNFNTGYNVWLKGTKASDYETLLGRSNTPRELFGEKAPSSTKVQDFNRDIRNTSSSARLIFVQLVSENTEPAPVFPVLRSTLKFQTDFKLLDFSLDPLKLAFDQTHFPSDAIEDTVELWSLNATSLPIKSFSKSVKYIVYTADENLDSDDLAGLPRICCIHDEFKPSL